MKLVPRASWINKQYMFKRSYDNHLHVAQECFNDCGQLDVAEMHGGCHSYRSVDTSPMFRTPPRPSSPH